MSLNLHQTTKTLVQKEKYYTAKIIQNLKHIDEHKLFAEWKYTSLFKYVTKGLGYSEAEANNRIAAVKLARKSKAVIKKIEQGSLSLTNAAAVNRALNELPKNQQAKKITKIIKTVENKSTRQAKLDLKTHFNLDINAPTKIILDNKITKKMERVRKLYSEELTDYELFDILLEEKLKTPKQPVRNRNSAAKNSRYIPKAVKAKVYNGKCVHCGSRRNLEYDHIKNFASGGTNSAGNTQLLCHNCNQRKRIKYKEGKFPNFQTSLI